ncbi:MRG-domain-containing protein [Podospora appendiculata]|uniref:Chromatin modification-related protein EAF3 n=1 Tax=Podospora appendiculata TaxID=314037 RepID=A0AAE0X3R7_9PEZI|nr:MRG-domain-containing protein [Podospora appendiculata]
MPPFTRKHSRKLPEQSKEKNPEPPENPLADPFAEKEALWAAAEEVNDRLLAFPTPASSTYVNKHGKATFDDRFTFAPRHQPKSDGKAGTSHPKIRHAIEAGTSSQPLIDYYSELPADVNVPLAGVAHNQEPIGSGGKRSFTLDDWSAHHLETKTVGLDIEPFKPTRRSAARSPPKQPVPSQWLGADDPGIMEDSEAADKDAEGEDSFHQRPSIKLPLPDHLKAMLVDDWENVTKNNQLVPLPHAHPVDEILNDYLNYERPNRQEGSASLEVLEEIIAGLREYFDKCLGRILLYRFERMQFHELHLQWNSDAADEHKGPCDTYGAEHLSRLLVSLPELIAQTNMDQQSVNRLREELTKFTTWFGRHVTNYFVSEYETPSQEYVDKARGV